MNVSNRKCIRSLSVKTIKASKKRNIIAVLAIALTALLFTSLITIALSINYSFQQSNFRQTGGYSHGGFKYLSEEQFNELKDDPLIKEYSMRRFVGMPRDVPFNKNHVEVSYCDENCAEWMYLEPKEGRFPLEGTNEAATDTKVLELLGVEPVIGNEFTMTFLVDDVETTQTFTLCGFWDYDEAIVANHVLIPQSRAEEIFDELGTVGKDGMTATYNMDVMFSNSFNIEEKVNQVLANHGYQSDDRLEPNYIATGVNWGYSASQLADTFDIASALVIAALLLLIIFTGYLIIYNVFQISVVNDIKFYGLLKTIGTTGKQLKRIIRTQALVLSLIGIPIGLVLGYGAGAVLTPVIITRLDGIPVSVLSPNPLIFVGSALFALVTVLISCRKPQKMAAKVSPIEAVRYTESTSGKRKTRRANKGASLFKMAWANLGRNRVRTVVTVLSLTLSVVLLNLVVTFTGGFDMDKYLKRQIVSDFIVSDAGYFQAGRIGEYVDESVIDIINDNGDITDGGVTYGGIGAISEYITEDHFAKLYGARGFTDKEDINRMLEKNNHDENGNVENNIQLYGMEDYCLDRLTVIDGDISKLHEAGGKYIAAYYFSDDYGNIFPDSNWAKVGDKVKLRYADEIEYFDRDTGEILEPGNIPDNVFYDTRVTKYHDVEYEVAALVDIPGSLSYRYATTEDEFILNAQTFVDDTGMSPIMYYAFDTDDEDGMEAFLNDYTNNQAPRYDYESKLKFVNEFESFRTMFLILGGALSFIIGLVGILNFINAILTGIITRKREFAVLQSVGMTGRQLKTMLVCEGLCYAVGSVVVSLILSLILAPAAGGLMQNIFWFFSYRFMITPVLAVTPFFIILGITIPLITYRSAARHSIVERLTETE